MRNYYYGNSPAAMFGGPATRIVKTLITINVAVFVLQLLGQAAGTGFLETYFALRPWSVTHELMIWQFVSYLFLHGGFFHIFFNMFTLYMFGNDLERRWGSTRFLKYYLFTGVGAGLCSWLVAMNSPVAVIGASGAIYGVLLAYGMLYPDRIVLIYGLFPVKIKWLVVFMGAIAFFSSVTGGQPGVAHIAHLGGMLFGYGLLRGRDWINRLQGYQARRRREELKRQFEIYYGELRRKIDDDNKKGPTIH